MYLKFSQFIEINQTDSKVISNFQHYLYLLSVRYLKVIKANDNKIKKLIKVHCKH